MPFDKWGIPYFYPDALHAGNTGAGTRFYWTQNNDIHKDDDYEGTAMVRIGKEHDSSDFKVIDLATGTFQFPYLTDGDGLDMSGPTGHHTGGETHECQGFTYMCDTNLMTNPPRFRFRKETYHVQYNDHPDGEFTSPDATGTCINVWKGFAWVCYVKKDGRSAGKDSRICECWWNNDPVADIKNWKMLKRVEDKGAGVTNWGVSATCDGDSYQVGTWSNIQFRFKSSSSDWSLHPLIPEPDNGPNINSIGGTNMSFSDCESRGYGKRADMPNNIEMKCLVKWDAGGRGKAHFKNVSLREIDPTLDFGDPTTPPTEPPTGGTTTVSGVFKFQQDINNLRTSACAGTTPETGGSGGSGGNTKFYTVTLDSEKEITNSSAWDNRTIITEKAVNSLSGLNGKVIKQIDIPLKKVGTFSGSFLVHMKIYAASSSGEGEVIYDCPTQIDPNTLTTSFAYYTFDFSSNGHQMVVGDRVGVSYKGTSSTNYVIAGYMGTDIHPNTLYEQFEGGTWQAKEGRELAMDMWE